jgi:hypothetical protein
MENVKGIANTSLRGERRSQLISSEIFYMRGYMYGYILSPDGVAMRVQTVESISNSTHTIQPR